MRTFVTILLVLCFVALALRFGVPEPTEGPSGDTLTGRPSALDTLETSRHLERLEAAIEVYRLKSARYPESLEEVVDAGLLGERALTYPGFATPYYYELVPPSYVLYPPRR